MISAIKTLISRYINPCPVDRPTSATYHPDMPYQAVCLFMLLSITTSIILISANIAATKIWNFCGIPVDAGVLIFPIIYVVGDLTVEIYGQKLANLTTLCSTCVGLIIMVIFTLARILPDYPEANNTAFYILTDELGRLFFASISSFAASGIVNNYVAATIRHHYTKSDSFYLRALASSAVARIIDGIVFETIAFYGKLPFWDFFTQLSFAFIIGMLIETAVSPVTNFLAQTFTRALRYTDGRIIS